MAVYQKRWSVEEYHKGIKQNASASRSPANSLKARANHFAMKAKVYLAAGKAAYKELNRINRIEVHYEPA